MTSKLWYKDCKTDSDSAIRQAELVSALPAIRALKKLLLASIEDIDYNQGKLDSYQIANWAFLQADYIGQKRALTKVIDLITIEELNER